MMLTLSYPIEPLLGLGSHDPYVCQYTKHRQKEKRKLTINIGNALLENLLENLGVLELFVDLADDSLGKLLLLTLTHLALVAHPRVENLLGLSSNGGALLKLVSLRLKLGGFLN